MGTSNRSTVITRLSILTILGAVSNFFQGLGGGDNAGYSSTPSHIPGGSHHHRPRFRPHVQNGKFVMKVHHKGRGSW